MIWSISYRTDPVARDLADRHYSRQTIGAAGFVPPGRCLVLTAPQSYWVTSWPFAEYVKHQWGGAWICSAFRREGGDMVASEMIREAVACTCWRWPSVPDLGMITFVDASKVRRKRDAGRCFLRAGFAPCGETKGGLLAFQLVAAEMPAPQAPHGVSGELFNPAREGQKGETNE